MIRLFSPATTSSSTTSINSSSNNRRTTNITNRINEPGGINIEIMSKQRVTTSSSEEREEDPTSLFASKKRQHESSEDQDQDQDQKQAASYPSKKERPKAAMDPVAPSSKVENNEDAEDNKPAGRGSIGNAAVNVPLFENTMQFPDQLWELLKYEELKDAIWWLPGDDEAFAIHEPIFSEKLLESHFRGNKFSSIIRKLNRWGFRKYVDRSLPPKTVAYYHRCFQKGRPDLIKLIEKEEGKIVQSPTTQEGERSHYSLFPEATMSQSMLAQAFQSQRSGLTPRSVADGLFGSNTSSIHSRSPARDPLTAAFASPMTQRSQSSILQSIFGQRTGPLPLTSPMPSTIPSTSSAAVALASASPAGLGVSTTTQSRDLLRQSTALQLSLRQQQPSTIEQHALLASMVNNIERERQQRQRQQQQQQEGRLLLALERERTRQMVQEQKQQEPDDAGSLFSLLANRHQRQFQQQQEAAALAAAACQIREQDRLAARRQQQQPGHADLSNQLHLQRQLQANIASPNPLLSPLGGHPSSANSSGLLGRRVLGQDSISIPGELLLTPQQHRIRQVLQLQRQQQQQQQQHQMQLDEELQRRQR